MTAFVSVIHESNFSFGLIFDKDIKIFNTRIHKYQMQVIILNIFHLKNTAAKYFSIVFRLIPYR